MTFEMFGVSPYGNIEFLGCFGKEETALRALDEYVGLGYRNVRYCVWKKR